MSGLSNRIPDNEKLNKTEPQMIIKIGLWESKFCSNPTKMTPMNVEISVPTNAIVDKIEFELQQLLDMLDELQHEPEPEELQLSPQELQLLLLSSQLVQLSLHPTVPAPQPSQLSLHPVVQLAPAKQLSAKSSQHSLQVVEHSGQSAHLVSVFMQLSLVQLSLQPVVSINKPKNKIITTIIITAAIASKA